MATITLKDIPTPIHRALKHRAKQHGRSLNKEALACLEAAVRPSRADVASLLADIRAHRANLPGKLKGTLIREARRSGRS
jgi:plasmid stability protein